MIQKLNKMSNVIKFSKVLGQVEVVNSDDLTTTVIVAKTGETKKLMNQYANLSDTPFTTTKKVKTTQRELTQEEKERVSVSVNNQVNEIFYVAGLGPEAKANYKSSKSKRVHL